MEDKEFDYINMIPLIDVMLVLLTIVLTTSTFIVTGKIPVSLPQVSQKSEAIVKAQTVQIDGQGNIYLNDIPVTVQALQDALKCLETTTPVMIKADKTIALQVFVNVLDVIQQAGFSTVSLQTEVKN